MEIEDVTTSFPCQASVREKNNNNKIGTKLILFIVIKTIPMVLTILGQFIYFILIHNYPVFIIDLFFYEWINVSSVYYLIHELTLLYFLFYFLSFFGYVLPKNSQNCRENIRVYINMVLYEIWSRNVNICKNHRNRKIHLHINIWTKNFSIYEWDSDSIRIGL